MFISSTFTIITCFINNNIMLVVVVFSTYTHVHNTIVRVPYGSVMYWSITWVLGTELPVWFASGFVHAC